MDPTIALARLRELLLDAKANEEINDPAEVITLFEGLDQWITQGGFAPAQWGGVTLRADEDGCPYSDCDGLCCHLSTLDDICQFCGGDSTPDDVLGTYELNGVVGLAHDDCAVHFGWTPVQ
jgi:hypothetical protein